ncbi:MAG: rhodanese-related sulfurtransferase [Ignavibacteriales bacterium]|nr:rhodanese-related sulfurtransferase [Ignavibacteriales bacterium]
MDLLKPYRVLLFYKFVPIHGYALFAQHHHHQCHLLGLKGRVLVAPEGINGTLSGTIEQTECYMTTLQMDQRFADTWFKIDECDGHVFDKLFVRAKEELVTFKAGENGNPMKRTGRHLSPEEWYETMQQDDVLIIDGRTDYEYDLGHFKDAIRPPVKSFRDFPQWIRENLSHYKDKTILTYCTGGVRCEKLTAFMLSEGFENVAQLNGGIVSYGKDPNVKGRLWEGLCYVFDKRIAVPINRAERYIPVSTCICCGTPCDRYINCANLDCHKQHFQCEECEQKTLRSCSEECKTAPRHEFQFIENSKSQAPNIK